MTHTLVVAAPALPVLSRTAASFAVFFTPFLHEDVAVVLAASCIHTGTLALAPAAGLLYAGVVASDIAIFFLGRLARSFGALRRLMPEPKLEAARERLRKNRVLAIASCRLIPGLLFATFTACGFVGMSFVDFLLPALATSAVFTALLLGVVLAFGHLALAHLRSFLGYAALALIVAFVTSVLVRRLWRAAFEPGAPAAPPGVDGAAAQMPVAAAERIPPILFYIPLGLRWIALGIRHGSLTLPALADPCIEAGGLWGESKSRCLRQIGPEQQRWVAPFATLVREANEAPDALLARAHAVLREAQLAYPIVAKPDVGWQGFGVQRIADDATLLRYLQGYPEGATLMLQQPIERPGEAGVFYVRMPGDDTGRVTSLTLRYGPHVVGDGRTSIGELIARDPRMKFKSQHLVGAHRMHVGLDATDAARVPAAGEVVPLSFIRSIRVGGLYRDARAFITPQMSERFDAIARSMPEFWFGRFDIRFESLEALQRGEEFAIIEINGAGAEAIHMWDPAMPFAEAYGELIEYQDLVFEIGRRNRERGHKPMSLLELYRFTMMQNRLTDRYPPSF